MNYNENKTIDKIITIQFLNEIELVCQKYNLSISHEDKEGSFIIESYSDKNIMWLRDSVIRNS